MKMLFFLILLQQKLFGTECSENEAVLVFDRLPGQIVGIEYKWTDWSVRGIDNSKTNLATDLGVEPGWKVKRVKFQGAWSGTHVEVQFAGPTLQKFTQTRLTKNDSPYMLWFDTSEVKARFLKQSKYFKETSGIEIDWSDWTVKRVSSNLRPLIEQKLFPNVQQNWKIKSVRFWDPLESFQIATLDQETKNSLQTRLQNHKLNMDYSITFKKPSNCESAKQRDDNVVKSTTQCKSLKIGEIVNVMRKGCSYEAEILSENKNRFCVKNILNSMVEDNVFRKRIFPKKQIKKGQIVYVEHSHKIYEATVEDVNQNKYSVQYKGFGKESNIPHFRVYEEKQQCDLCKKTDHRTCNCSLVQCNECSQYGHTKYNCPRLKALKTETNKLQCYKCFQYGQMKHTCPKAETKRETYVPKNQPTCSNCEEIGHVTYFCPEVCGRDCFVGQDVYLMQKRTMYQVKITAKKPKDHFYSVKFQDEKEEHNVPFYRIYKDRPKCSHCEKMDHTIFYCPNIQCKYCHKYGHKRARDCVLMGYKLEHKYKITDQKKMPQFPPVVGEKCLSQQLAEDDQKRVVSSSEKAESRSQIDDVHEAQTREAQLKRKRSPMNEERSYILNELESDVEIDLNEDEFEDIYQLNPYDNRNHAEEREVRDHDMAQALQKKYNKTNKEYSFADSESEDEEIVQIENVLLTSSFEENQQSDSKQ